MLIPVLMFAFKLKRSKNIIKIFKIFLLYSIPNQNLHIEFLVRFKLKANITTGISMMNYRSPNLFPADIV
jgi:hypothetical protein